MENTIEIVTITKVNGRNISYNSQYWSGCDISNFPNNSNVGEKYKIISNFSKILKVEKVN